MSAAALALRARLLGPPGRTLAVAESLTGGRLQALITGVSGASGYFLGGVTAYTIPQKARLLGVDAAHAAEVDAFSARVAAEMACGACRLFGADVGVATTGYAEPAPGREAPGRRRKPRARRRRVRRWPPARLIAAGRTPQVR